jgi:hypothetical protein
MLEESILRDFSHSRYPLYLAPDLVDCFPDPSQTKQIHDLPHSLAYGKEAESFLGFMKCGRRNESGVILAV